MEKTEKTEFLKARVSAKTKNDFEKICDALDVQPTVKLREMVERFVVAEIERLGERVVVHVFRPSDYMQGAWRVTIKLRDAGALMLEGTPIPFELPDLPHRLFRPDDGFAAVVQKSGTRDEYAIGGKFEGGVWRGHLYSNGIPEERNPTSIAQVEETLKNTVTELLDGYVATAN